MNRRAVIAGGAALGTLAMGGAALLFVRRSDPATDLSLDDILRDPDQPVLGNPRGDVTVAEFFDYQCPFCKRGHHEMMDEIAADGGVRLVMKDLPIFGGTSVTAAQMVLGGVERGEYARAQAALMATPARLSERDLLAALTGAGLDPDALMASYARGRAQWDGLLSRNSHQAAVLGLQGTPAFIIGQQLLPGALDRTQLRTAIAQARALSPA